MTVRIVPDDLTPGTWITVRRRPRRSSVVADPEVRYLESMTEAMRRPIGPPPGRPLRVFGVSLPFVYVKEMDLAGHGDRVAVVDLDQDVVVGLDVEIVDRIVDEVHKARCLRTPLADPQAESCLPTGPVGEEIESLPSSSASTSLDEDSAVLEEILGDAGILHEEDLPDDLAA